MIKSLDPAAHFERQQHRERDFCMTKIEQLRWVALGEGASFLLLLFIAMPLKYMAGIPLAVRIAGMIHGLLFIAFMVTLIGTSSEREWSFKRSLTAFLASILPFGTFVFDRSLKSEIEAMNQKIKGCFTLPPNA
jgi:integral membrane protein